jgi:peptidyl-tRNA hydrolase, PTH1 family
MGLFGRSSRSSDSSGKNTSSFDALVIGLGNPGKQYARSRHNVGEEVVVELARRGNEALKSGRDSALVAEVRITNATQNTKRAVLAFPTTFMNESGQAVRKLMRRYGFKSVDALIVIQDELDLAPGTVKIKKGGGTQWLAKYCFARRNTGVHPCPSWCRQTQQQGARSQSRALQSSRCGTPTFRCGSQCCC